MFPVSIPRIFEINGKVSVVELLLSEVAGEISTFCISVENFNTRIGMSQKVVLLEIWKSPLLSRFARSQSYSQAYTLNSSPHFLKVL